MKTPLARPAPPLPSPHHTHPLTRTMFPTPTNIPHPPAAVTTQKAMCLFQPSKRLKSGCFMWLTPLANKGKADICRVEESESGRKETRWLSWKQSG